MSAFSVLASLKRLSRSRGAARCMSMGRTILLVALVAELGATRAWAQGPIAKEIRPPPGIGQFHAALQGDTLRVTLRVRYEFHQGDSTAVPGFPDSEYVWDTLGEQRFKTEFRNRVENAWSNKYDLRSNDGARTVSVVVSVRETNLAQAHWKVDVFKYRDDALDTEASVCNPGEHHGNEGCEPNSPATDLGSVLLASTHLLTEYVQDLEIAPVDIWFTEGSDAPPRH
jgi:hypothetical protein